MIRVGWLDYKIVYISAAILSLLSEFGRNISLYLAISTALIVKATSIF